MRGIFFIVLLAFSLGAHGQGWKATENDGVPVATVTDSSDHFFSVTPGGEKPLIDLIFGFTSSSFEEMQPGELKIRVDSNEARNVGALYRVEQLLEDSKRQLIRAKQNIGVDVVYEPGPSLVQMGSRKVVVPESTRDFISQLKNGSTLFVRYTKPDGTPRTVKFSLAGSSKAIGVVERYLEQ